MKPVNGVGGRLVTWMEDTGHPGGDEVAGIGTRRVGHGVAHAKAVLFGEHAVLYGAPALVVPVPALTATAEVAVTEKWADGSGGRTIDVEVNGTKLPRHVAGGQSVGPSLAPALAAAAALDRLAEGPEPGIGALRVDVGNAIPTGRGLGSSAAMALAIIDAVTDLCGRALSGHERFELAQIAEHAAHGRSSGIDIHGAAADGPVLVRAGRGSSVDVSVDSLVLVADTGVPGRTHIAIRTVADHVASARGAAIMERLIETAAAGVIAAQAHDPAALGELMTESHRCLAALGVSSHELDRCVSAALGAGAHGAKLTGGGLGGCLVVAVSAERAATVVDALSSAGAVACWTLAALNRETIAGEGN